ncbi:MAG: hypothetical protein WCP03_02745 [Candidatus Saccharibacteria bacterium]
MVSKKITKKSNKKLKPAKLPSSWDLIKKTWFELTTFWRPLLGVSIVYAVLYFVLVMGLSFSSSLQDSSITGSSRMGDAFSSVFSVFSSSSLSGSSSSDATVLVQFILFLAASMAFVWSLRKLQALKKIKMSDAYYKGTATLIPTILVSFILVATLLPVVGGSSLLANVLQNGGSGTEIAIVTAISGILLLISCYLFSMYWPAFYIVSLPDTKPFQALRSSMKVTKKRRFAIIRKALVLDILMVLSLFIVLLPIALVLPSIIPLVSFLLIFIIFGIMHVYLYVLYRSLL